MKKILAAILGAFSGFLALTSTAEAQTDPTLPPSAPDASAAEQPTAPDYQAIEIEPQWRVRTTIENDSLNPMTRSDRDYSSGIRIEAERVMASGTSVQFTAGHNIYTPRLSEARRGTGRTNAALVYATAAVMEHTARSASAVQVTVGVAGPKAKGAAVQNRFHAIMGEKPRDWSRQIDGDTLANLTYARADVIAEGPVTGDTQYRIATLGEIGVGSIASYARAGVVLQIGSDNAGDVPSFSNHLPAPRLRFHTIRAEQSLSYHFYAAAAVRATVHDWTIDNRRSHIKRNSHVMESAIGLKWSWRRLEGDIALMRTEREYETQRQPSQAMRLSIGYRF